MKVLTTRLKKTSVCSLDEKGNRSFCSSGLPPGHTLEACEGLRCISQAQLDAAKKLMTEVQSVYKTIVVNERVPHQEEDEEEEEELFEGVMDTNDDSDTDKEIIGESF